MERAHRDLLSLSLFLDRKAFSSLNDALSSDHFKFLSHLDLLYSSIQDPRAVPSYPRLSWSRFSWSMALASTLQYLKLRLVCLSLHQLPHVVLGVYKGDILLYSVKS